MDPNSNNTGIAIVGVAAELPSGIYSDRNLDYASFFEFLLNKGEAYEQIPKERFNVQFLQGKGSGQIITNAGAFLKDAHLFDYLEFGITAKDARAMPLSTRRLIETTFLSLVDSGINYRGRNIGCYMAGVAHDMPSISGHVDSDVKGVFSFSPGMVANRVSYHLDLRGPSIPLDTACSSTLYATHLACQSLMLGECEAAVVGGCQINHRFTEWLQYSHGGIISRDGRCKPFDATADGFGRGEGVVVVTLKPLNAALRDSDRIYATILGTGVNSSGAIAPVNAPVASAQCDAMRRAFSQAKREPQDVDYIELHATGTAQGDPTEANWVGESFQRDEELIVGSVKGNIGHLEITAFLASLCKICAMFETRLIPPNVNLKTLNPSIQWDKYRMRVPIEVEKLPCRGSSGISLVSMTSSGIGGANGHCVVEGPPCETPPSTSVWQKGHALPSLIVAGGLSPRSLADVQSSLTALATKQDISAMDRSLGRRARSMIWRSFAISYKGHLSQFSGAALVPKIHPPVVFVFSGQGPQHLHMGRELYDVSPVFRRTIAELDDVYRDVVGKSLVETTGLFKTVAHPQPLDEIWPIEITLPALTMLQLALVETLASVGVTPAVVVGHSAGETAMLAASGAARNDVALRLAIARGKALSALESVGGTMAALSCSPDRARCIIDDVVAELGPATLEIGCFNSAESVTLSGSTGHIELAVSKSLEAGIAARQLRTRIPVHSSMMKACQQDYRRRVGDVFADQPRMFPKTQTYSTVSGALATAFDADYFWNGTIGPVLFTDAISTIISRYPRAIFVEIGPHPVLGGYIHAASNHNATVVCCPLRRSKTSTVGGDVRTFLECLGKLALSGCDLDFDSIFQSDHPAAHPDIPLYPLQRKDIQYISLTPEITRQRQSRNGPLNYPQLQINTRTHPELADHVIKGEPIMPAAGYLEMALEFGARKLWNVKFISVLILSNENPIDCAVSLDGTRWNVKSAFPVDYSKTWPIQFNRLHAEGFLVAADEADLQPPPIAINDIRNRLAPVNMKGFYDEFSSFAQYGPTYQRITACWRGWDKDGCDEILVQIRGADTDIPEVDDYRIHPAILDSAIHAVVHPIFTGMKDKSRYYLPSGCESLTTHDALARRPFPNTIFTFIKLRHWTPGELTYNAIVCDEHGIPLCTITQLKVTLHGFPLGVDKRYKLVYQETGTNISSEITTYRENGEFTNGHNIQDFGLEVQRNFAYTADLDCATPQLSKITLLQYVRGRELELQPKIQCLDPLQNLSLWIVATSGLDGDACLGFTRSLRREYLSWTVQAVVVNDAWTDAEKMRAIQTLTSIPDLEPEIIVDASGNILVPRIISSDAPKKRAVFDAKLPWIFQNSALRQTSISSVPSRHATIRVLGVASYPGTPWAYLGELKTGGVLVAGITSAPLSNYIAAREGTYIELDDTWRPLAKDLTGPHILAYIITSIAVGAAAFPHPERLVRCCVIVTHSDVSPGRQIVQLLTPLCPSVLAIPSKFDASEIHEKLMESHVSSVIISATQELHEVQLLEQLTPSNGKLVLWNYPGKGIAHTLDADPWQISDALELALRYGSRITDTFDPPLKKTGLETLPDEAASDIPLFDSSKSYVLIGGIGSLGLQIAVWMYQKGAREIMLTSRSGRDGLLKRQEFIAQRSLEYLERLSDLDLHLKGADAISEDSMKAALSDLQKPLGGCMILTAVLNDRAFNFMTPSVFEPPFTSKVDVYKTLDRIVDLAALDFVIGTTSVSGLFGNAGQTNYAAANTALAGLMRHHRNSIVIAVPAIIDTGTYVHWSMNALAFGRLKHLTAWGMTCRELCDFIEDALLKLRDESGEEYVPNFDWSLVSENFGPSHIYNHLLPSDVEKQEVMNSDSSKITVRDMVCRCLEIGSEDLSPDVPLTSYGLDSLTAASLSHALQPFFSVTQIQLLADLTLSDLEARAKQTAQDRTAAPDVTHSLSRNEDIALKSEEMERIVETITRDIPHRVSLHHPLTHSEGDETLAKTILITGTTGSIGAHMLAQLLTSQNVRKIFVLMRKHDHVGRSERQINAFQLRGLDASLLHSDKLVISECDLQELALGMSPPVLKEVQESLTHIVHLAWPVNFSAPLSSYAASIQELRRLIDIGTPRCVRMVYSSSIGIFRNLERNVRAPEDQIMDPAVAIGSGYCESKWVAEQILRIAGERNSVRPTIVRIGQMTGGMNGAWNPLEWVPSLISASSTLGCIPDGVGNVSWLPVEVGASALVDMLESSKPILHLRHPRPIPWSVIMGHFASALSIDMVSRTDWFARLETQLHSTADEEITRRLEPAKRLLDFFHVVGARRDEDLKNMEDNGVLHVCMVSEGIAASPTLQDEHLRQLGRQDVEKWVKYWRDIGHLLK